MIVDRITSVPDIILERLYGAPATCGGRVEQTPGTQLKEIRLFERETCVEQK